MIHQLFGSTRGYLFFKLQKFVVLVIFKTAGGRRRPQGRPHYLSSIISAITVKITIQSPAKSLTNQKLNDTYKHKFLTISHRKHCDFPLGDQIQLYHTFSAPFWIYCLRNLKMADRVAEKQRHAPVLRAVMPKTPILSSNRRQVN